MIDIKFIWNGSFVGTNHTLIVNGVKHRLCGIVSNEKESEIEALSILKEKYNIDYPIEDIKWEWGGSL